MRGREIRAQREWEGESSGLKAALQKSGKDRAQRPSYNAANAKSIAAHTAAACAALHCSGVARGLSG